MRGKSIRELLQDFEGSSKFNGVNIEFVDYNTYWIWGSDALIYCHSQSSTLIHSELILNKNQYDCFIEFLNTSSISWRTIELTLHNGRIFMFKILEEFDFDRNNKFGNFIFRINEKKNHKENKLNSSVKSIYSREIILDKLQNKYSDFNKDAVLIERKNDKKSFVLSDQDAQLYFYMMGLQTSDKSVLNTSEYYNFMAKLRIESCNYFVYTFEENKNGEPILEKVVFCNFSKNQSSKLFVASKINKLKSSALNSKAIEEGNLELISKIREKKMVKKLKKNGTFLKKKV